MILCDREIKEALDRQSLIIDPAPAADFYSSTSVDLRLDSKIATWIFPDSAHGVNFSTEFDPASPEFSYQKIEAAYTKPTTMTADGFLVAPANFLLGYTIEKIYLPHRSRICARVEGKSSLARLGLGVHVTAPTIHAGFGHAPSGDHGTPVRLEIWNTGPIPIRLRPTMRICQLILEEVREVPTTGYAGQFNAQGK